MGASLAKMHLIIIDRANWSGYSLGLGNTKIDVYDQSEAGRLIKEIMFLSDVGRVK